MKLYKSALVILVSLGGVQCCIAANGSSQILVKAVQVGNDMYIGDFAGNEQNVYRVSADGSGTPKKLPLLRSEEATSEKLVSTFDIKDNHLYYTLSHIWVPSHRIVEMNRFLLDDFNALKSGVPHAPYKEMETASPGVYLHPQIDFYPLSRLANSLDAKQKEDSFHYDFVVLPNGYIRLFTLLGSKLAVDDYEITAWHKGEKVVNEHDQSVMNSPFRGAFHAMSDVAGNCFLVSENGTMYTVSGSAVTEISRLTASDMANSTTRAGVILFKDTTSGLIQVIGSGKLLSTSPSVKTLQASSSSNAGLQPAVLSTLKSVLPKLCPPQP